MTYIIRVHYIMERRRLGRTDIYVSPIGLGCRRIHKVGTERAVKIIRYAVSLGVNLIDTSNIYGDGRSEEIIGEAIRDIRRRVILATKGGIVKTKDDLPTQDLRPESIRRSVEESLRRLGTDYIDLYQIHYPDPMTPLEATIGALMEYIESGTIRYIGLSNFSHEELIAAADLYDVPSIQIPYNFLQHKLYDEVKSFCRSREISVIPYTPLLMGLLTERVMEHRFIREGEMSYIPPNVIEECKRIARAFHAIVEKTGRSMAQLILNWLVNRPGITCLLVGMNNTRHIEENITAIRWKMPYDVMREIESIADDVNLSLDNEFFIQGVRDVSYNYAGKKVAILEMGMKLIVPPSVTRGDHIKISWNGEYLGKY